MEYLRFPEGGEDPSLVHQGIIAAGGHGEVHKYFDDRHGQVFARKLIRLEGNLSEQKRTVENEVRAISKLYNLGGHTNIVSVFRHGEVSNRPLYYIDMELCDGTLREFMHENGRESNSPITVRHVWNIMAQIADGLSYIHYHGEVHRDIKPNNILFSKRDQIWKIADFGLTREGTSNAMHTTNFARGTGGYRAPELLKESSKYNNKVDIWAMGCIFYELAIGKRAFVDDLSVYLFSQSTGALRASEDRLIDQLWGREITSLLDDMLHLDPEKRDRAANLCRRFAFNYNLTPTTTSGFETSTYSYSYGHLHFDFPTSDYDGSHDVFHPISTGSSCCAFRSLNWRTLRPSIGVLLTENGVNIRQVSLPDGKGLWATSLRKAKDGVISLAATGMDTGLFIWNVTTGEAIARYDKKGSALAFQHSGEHLVYGESDGKLEVLRMERDGVGLRLEHQFTLQSGDNEMRQIGYHRNDELFFALCEQTRREDGNFEDYRLQVWNALERKQLCNINITSIPNGLCKPGFHPFERKLLIVTRNGYFELFDAVSGERLAQAIAESDIICATYSPCGKYVLTAHYHGKEVKVWDASSFQQCHTITDLPGRPLELWFHEQNAGICFLMTLGTTSKVLERLYLINFSDERRKFGF